MKYVLLLLSIVISSSFLLAQNDHVKIISTKTNQVINGTTYKIYGDAARIEMKENFFTVMESTDSSLIALKRYEIDTIAGSEEYFCWYLCYTKQPAGSLPIWIADDSLMLYQNDTIADFAVYLRPNGTMGTACYRYVWQPESDPNDSSWVDICFDILRVGVEENENVATIDAFPNPVSNIYNVNITDVKVKGRMVFELRDLQGRLIVEKEVMEGSNNLNFNDQSIERGLYLGSIKNQDSRIWTERIIVE